MTSSGFWIGIESMSAEVLAGAATHPRPVFCGRLTRDSTLRAGVAETGAQAEWHDIALDTAIGQGYLLDLMRQRAPIEKIVMAISPASIPDVSTTSLDATLAETRGAVESLIMVTRCAEAVMEPNASGGMTVVCPGEGSMTSVGRGVMGFVEKFVAAESERWRSRGLSLTLTSAVSLEQ